MLIIYVDGDACPVKPEALRVAERHGLEVYIVSNAGMRPSQNPKVHMVVVGAAMDAADDWIVEHAGSGDVVISADILLADRCLKKGAAVIGPNGKVFTADNIGAAVASRTLNAHLRELGGTTHHAVFGQQDRSRFLQALEQAVQTIKRS